MLVHLLLFLIRSATGRPPSGPGRRERKGAKVVFECPLCHEIQVVAQHQIMDYDAKGQLAGTETKLPCGKCNRAFLVDHFKANDAGVYQVRTWQCPQCKAENPNIMYRCQTCEYRLV